MDYGDLKSRDVRHFFMEVSAQNGKREGQFPVR